MDISSSPQFGNICFNIAALALILVIMVIHITEESNVSLQKQIFGAIIVDAFLINLMGLIHNLWLYDDYVREIISYQTNSAVVITEKICSYIFACLSILYVMTIFRIKPESLFRKSLILVPTAYAVGVFLTGFLTDFFFYFDPYGNLKFRYPQGATVNIGVILYFIFATYLYIKYSRGLSTEKFIALVMYYLLMLTEIPVRIITKSSSTFGFEVAIVLLLCVYTFQNPSEFSDSLSGAGTKNALYFCVSNNLLQKKVFTILGISIERLDVILGAESLETSSDLLMQITQYLKQICGEGNIFYTGDGHFLMLFPEAEPDDPVIEKTTDLIKKRFRDSWILNNRNIKLFESPYAIGFPDEVDSLEKFNEVQGIIHKVLMRHNRDILRVSDLNLKHVEHDKKIDNIVKHALEDRLLEVYYQPIYCPETGKFSSCEALLRLKDPHLGFISPAVFMPIAERNGTVLSIDAFVLSSVCEMISSTEASSLGIDYVEVNLSVVDCIQTNLAENVIKTLDKYMVRPDQINFEITETFEEGITYTMDENIRKLTEHGLRFSMDDFGTGYSNLARIASLPVNIFKLDKSIVQSAFESGTSYMVMLNLIKIIKSLGKEIVAEGVETGEQAKQIIRMGCDHIQGFFYARPMPKDQFLAFLREHNK